MGRGVPREELIGEAEAALLWAASRFDEGRGTRFSTYAIPFVLGALRELCRSASPMRVPRAEQRVLAAARDARDALRAEYSREPTIAELSARVGVEPERLCLMLSAQERMAAPSVDVSEAVDLASARDLFEDWVLLRDAISRLPKPYAQVLWLRFAVGLSQAEAAARLSTTQSCLSRWEQKARALLRERLAE